jgi:hypothetical protein
MTYSENRIIKSKFIISNKAEDFARRMSVMGNKFE